MDKTVVILPAFNAGRFLADVIKQLNLLHPEYIILVVNDGSTDNTAEVAASTNAVLIEHNINQGKGAALRTGFDWAIQNEFVWACTMDSDGQHLPSELHRFTEVAQTQHLDVVIGSRMNNNENMPWLRKATNIFTSWVVSRIAGSSIQDSQSGYRLFKLKPLSKIELKSTNYDLESEILIKLSWSGAKIGSVPITTVYGDEISSINKFKDTVRFFSLAFRLMINKMFGRLKN